MMWLWLALLWLTSSCALSVVMGSFLRAPDEPTSLADDVESWLELQAPV